MHPHDDHFTFLRASAVAVLLTVAAVALVYFLAGCCTPAQPTGWDYGTAPAATPTPANK